MENLLDTAFLKIDLDRKRYKPLHTVFFIFKIGTWKPLPVIRSVAVAKIKLKQMGTSRANTQTIHVESTYCVFMRAKNANIRIYTNENLAKVLKNAEVISEFLDKPLTNYCLK